jgi:fimbrial chaperone protein
MRLFRRTAAALALALTLPAFCADLSIMPVAVQLDAQHDRSTVRVTNQGKEAVILQADAIGWAREAGVDRDTATSDLIVNPPVFTVAPGQTQIVRVGVRRGNASETESTYRMVLREVPSANPGSETLQGQVRVLVAVRVPVYVAPNVVRRQQQWAARYDASGQLVAAVTNSGNVHYKVGSLRLASEDASATVHAEGPQSVVMPGEAHSFVLRAPLKPAGDKPLTLEVQTDNGMQYVPIEIAQK